MNYSLLVTTDKAMLHGDVEVQKIKSKIKVKKAKAEYLYSAKSCILQLISSVHHRQTRRTAYAAAQARAHGLRWHTAVRSPSQPFSGPHPMIHAITWITTHLTNPKGWKAE